MSIKLTVPTTTDTLDLKPNITVIGVGGAGGNAVNNMIESGLEGVEFLVANSDAQALAKSSAERRIQIGIDVTRGLGAGSNPDIGRAAAEESLEEILGHIQHSNMLFVTAGLGGGTGTGAAPVIARAARDYGILTIGVVTKPFHFEGERRMRLAEAGLKELQQYVDTLLIIPNQNLFYVANEQTTFADAFQMADQVLYSGVRGVTDLMVSPGLINLDFADIKSVMSEMGKAMMGTGEAEGDNRAVEAAEAAISNPLLDDSSMHGARGVLINITAGKDITLFEVDEAANRIRKEVDDEANIIFGSTFDEALEGSIRVSVVATGIDSEVQSMPEHDAPAITDARAAEPTTLEAPEPKAEPQAAPAPVAVFPRPVPQTPRQAPQPEIADRAERAEKPVYTKPVPSVTGITAPASQPATAASLEPAPAIGEAPAPAPMPAQAQAEAFIPAPPVMGNLAIDEAPKADPFTAADMVNTRIEAEEIEPQKKSLFERVTGVARSERRVPKRERALPKAMQAEPEPEIAEIDAEPVIEETPPALEITPDPAPEISPEPEANLETETPEPETIEDEIAFAVTDQDMLADPEPEEAAPEAAESAPEIAPEPELDDQGAFGGLDPDENLGDGQESDDLLEIPAFLRRQAN